MGRIAGAHTYDAVVVGARCAGSVLAGQLARAGQRVLLVDKANFPSDTVSTHICFPNTVARFAQLGILDRLTAKHDVPELQLHWRFVGVDVAPTYTPVDGHAGAIGPRRVVLDQALVDWAADAGAELTLGTAAVGLLGAGTADDPARGVTLSSGEEIAARWVIGADGRASSIASWLGLEKTREMRGEMCYLLAYWRDLPERRQGGTHVSTHRTALMWNPCEDGIDILSFAADADLTSGSASERMARYQAGIRSFPDLLDPAAVARAEMVGDLVVVPETMMRGFYRQPTGPGWALVGDAGHFKHPGTAQGISDAVEQALYVAAALGGDDPELAGYEAWRDERTQGHYEWSFVYGSWPKPALAERYFSGIASESDALQDWADVFTRHKRPAELDTRERLTRWFS